MLHRVGPRLGRVGLCCAWAVMLGALPARPAAAVEGNSPADRAAPVVAGFERLKSEGKADPAVLGEVLLGELNCLACHTAEKQQHVQSKGAPDLSAIGARVTPQWIQAYLLSPHSVKPGATMPDLFHASEPGPKAGAVEFLTHYLVSLGGPIAPSTEDANEALIAEGKKLYHSVGCVACHAPEGAAPSGVSSVPLGDLASKETVDSLTAFLLDPLKSRPSGRMPASNLSHAEAQAIALYLLRDQANNPQSANLKPVKASGTHFAYYEAAVSTAKLEAFDALKPKSQGSLPGFTLDIPGRRETNFAVKYAGTLTVPNNGHYNFFTRSDDGSCLYIDSKLVVDNDGVRPAADRNGSIELTKGPHEIVVTYFQGGGESELSVRWSAEAQEAGHPRRSADQQPGPPDDPAGDR